MSKSSIILDIILTCLLSSCYGQCPSELNLKFSLTLYKDTISNPTKANGMKINR
jgi:hypothetical protein